MNTLRQVQHVWFKDVRLARIALVLYVVGLAVSASGVLATTASPVAVPSSLLVLLGVLVAATAVQDDAALTGDAMWRSQPLDTMAVAASKLVMIASLVIVALLAQLAAASAFGLTLPVALRIAANAHWVTVIWLCAAIIAASTPDLKRFALVAIVAPLLTTITFYLLAGALNSDRVFARVLRATRVPVLSAVMIAAGCALVALVYARRIRNYPAWLSVGVLVFVTTLRVSLAASSLDSAVNLPLEPTGAVFQPDVSVSVGFDAAGTPAALLNIRYDRADSVSGQVLANERLVLQSGTMTLRFVDGHTRLVHLWRSSGGTQELHADGTATPTHDVWGENTVVLKEASALTEPRAARPHAYGRQSRFPVDSLNAAERAELAGGRVTASLSGSAIVFASRPAIMVPVVRNGWTSERGVRAFFRDTTTRRGYVAELVVQTLPGAVTVANSLATGGRADNPDIVLYDVEACRVYDNVKMLADLEDATLVISGTSLISTRLNIWREGTAHYDAGATGSALSVGGHGLSVAVVGWDAVRRVQIERADMPVTTVNAVLPDRSGPRTVQLEVAR